MNPDTIGYVWTGEYDLNTLRADGEIFESGTKKLRIRKYPDTCGQGLIKLRPPSLLDLLNAFFLQNIKNCLFRFFKAILAKNEACFYFLSTPPL